MKIWLLPIAYWIPKATNTHSEYVLIIAFPLQQWLQECTTALHRTILPILYILKLSLEKLNDRC